MSCNYADGLSPYDNKGVLGLAEKFDSEDDVNRKCQELAELMRKSKHTVIHTGAGISTSAGIPDFRGPKGVWTLEEKGLKPKMNVAFDKAKPTKTHMAIKKFIDENIVHYVVSQNIDGLHLRSGISREHLAELHGNMFIEQCDKCKKQFVRSTPSPTVGRRLSENLCKSKGRPCRGKLHDTILDWEHSLPDDDLELSDMHSSLADLSICMGTTLQIVPSGNIPLNTLRSGGNLVICNLQPTKHDNKADLIINTYVDQVIEKIATILGITIPEYGHEEDPTFKSLSDVLEWTVDKSQVIKVKKMHHKKCNGVPKVRVLVKRPSDFKNSDKPPKLPRTKNEESEKPPKIGRNKKEKSEKPPKLKKAKIYRNKKEDEDIIVVDDLESDGSDVICIDDINKEDVTTDSKDEVGDTKDAKPDSKDKVIDTKDMKPDSKDNISNTKDVKPDSKDKVSDKKEVKADSKGEVSDAKDAKSDSKEVSDIKADIKNEVSLSKETSKCALENGTNMKEKPSDGLTSIKYDDNNTKFCSEANESNSFSNNDEKIKKENYINEGDHKSNIKIYEKGYKNNEYDVMDMTPNGESPDVENEMDVENSDDNCNEPNAT